ncbi:MAG: hypothetical protein M1327_02740 [Candidatus Thermoplasmatota archaeon]|nr:hypothetical protein [Candidatus Thermoplasmatota archaeon]
MVKENKGTDTKKETDDGEQEKVIDQVDEGQKTDSKSDEKNVSVKGVQKSLYQRILELGRETGKSVGELTNDAYKALLVTASGAKEFSQHFVEGAKQASVQSIDNITELEITGSELKELKRKVSFNHVKQLKISDITDSEFSSIVVGIHNVEDLTVSKQVKKTTVLKVCSFVNRIKLE